MGAKVGRRGRRNRGIKRIRWLLGITGVLPIALVTTPSPAQAAYGNMCDYAVVIGVRGTDAAPGKGSLHSGRLYSDGGFGTEIQPLINQLRRDVFPYYHHALNYPAAGGTGYIDSVNKGRSRLIAELNYVANSCGKIKPAVVLAGHSQGAAVVLAALIDDGTSSGNLTSKARAMIRAVAVYGDPLFKKSQAMNAPGAQDQKNGLLGARPSAWTTQLNQLRYVGWPMGGTKAGWVQIIRSYCYAGDLFCASGTGSKAIDIHNSYGVKETYKVWQWIDYMLSNNN
jgi:hypothetical protein